MSLPETGQNKIPTAAMDRGKIIFLNGVSSSGKTTLSKALQDALDEPYCVLSIDQFIGMLPEKLVKHDLGRAVLLAQANLHHTIRLFSDLGRNVIADHVLLSYFGSLEECVSLLHDYPVLFVRVVCPVHELRRREQARGDRQMGQGESQLEDLRPQEPYDLTVDTYAQTTDACVDAIAHMLCRQDRCSAFQTLWEQAQAHAP